jgi:hypothetical protein
MTDTPKPPQIVFTVDDRFPPQSAITAVDAAIFEGRAIKFGEGLRVPPVEDEASLHALISEIMATTPDLTAQVAELREIVGRMTPGPWEHHTNALAKLGKGSEWIRAADNIGSWVVASLDFGYDDLPSDQQLADATGIVALRNTALPIIDALMAENERLREALAFYAEPCDAPVDGRGDCGMVGNMCCLTARDALKVQP